MNPEFLVMIDNSDFHKYLNQAKNYFEFGSGRSTYQAFLRYNIENIYSVESDKVWYQNLFKLMKDNERVHLNYVEMDTPPNDFGNPGKNSTPEQWKNYSDQILLLDKEKANKIDFIMIDGRFRVACCLKAFDVINDDCVIAFDDFLNRKHYHIVLDYYDMIGKSRITESQNMVFLKKKKECKGVPKEVIEKYELIKG